MKEAEQQTIMIVDDTPINIQILSDLLGEGHRILFATSGPQALEILQKTQPDLILLDVMMPEMNGYDVCAAIKRDPLLVETPVIFITALSQTQDEISGLKLGAVDYITKPFNPDVVRLRVKNQLELKMYRDRYARSSLLDGLTGIANRRAFDDCLNREWLRALRNKYPLSLCMIDIDYFKFYNDAYGHLQGDDCLKRVASALEGSLVRPGDMVARYGGEEYVCVLPETDEQGATVIAERLRAAVQGLALPHAASQAAEVVTISVGSATAIPRQTLSAEALIKQADDMLYRAKELGRNKVQAGRLA